MGGFIDLRSKMAQEYVTQNEPTIKTEKKVEQKLTEAQLAREADIEAALRSDEYFVLPNAPSAAKQDDVFADDAALSEEELAREAEFEMARWGDENFLLILGSLKTEYDD